jgi:hypothetical protein
MASTIETGHAINLANFEKLTEHVYKFEGSYNPIPERLKYENLISALSNTKTAFERLNTANAPYLIAISTRESAFAPIKKLLSRIVKAAEVLSINPTSLKAIKELVRKLRGNRAVAKKSQEELDNAEKNIVYRSVSQLSFDQRMEHFAELITILQGQHEYTPNEKELTFDYLHDLLNKMRAANIAVVENEIPLTKARSERNILLYTPITGLVSLALDVKKYILSAFGKNSPEYREIKDLKFRKKQGT